MAIIKRAQSFTQTSRTEEVYADVTSSFAFHPTKLDLLMDVNEEAVKQSIKNILLTNRGERLFNPTFGSDLRSILFENFSPQTESQLKEYIEMSVNNYEPRAALIDVVVQAIPDLNAYSATIVFSVINKAEPITLEFLLDRVR